MWDFNTTNNADCKTRIEITAWVFVVVGNERNPPIRRLKNIHNAGQTLRTLTNLDQTQLCFFNPHIHVRFKSEPCLSG